MVEFIEIPITVKFIEKLKQMGRNIYYPTIFGHILNRNNQTFMKLRKILKENFI